MGVKEGHRKVEIGRERERCRKTRLGFSSNLLMIITNLG